MGPRWGEGDEDQKLANAVRNALTLADGKQLRSIAFPAISTGIFGFPKERAAKIILFTTITYLKENSTSLRRVIFCLYDPTTLAIFKDAFTELTKTT